MKRSAIVAALLLVAGCHRAPVGDEPDADADLRARTAAKTSADLAAADAAARRPLPRIVAPQPIASTTRPPADEPERSDAATLPDLPDNQSD